MGNPDVRQEFADPGAWEATLKELIRFRILDIQDDEKQGFRAASSALVCGELGILSVDAPAPFGCKKNMNTTEPRCICRTGKAACGAMASSS
jgi:hypothetical protein